MHIPKGTTCNPKIQKQHFNGKLYSAGLDFYYSNNFQKIYDKLVDIAKESKSDLIIQQKKRKKILYIIAQKAEDFKLGCGKRKVIELPAQKILPDEKYVEYARKVTEEYNKPNLLTKLFNIFISKFIRNS